ncbi:Crp/Fnr family transcriptional regulator [Actibacterium sp.]|uniref:Crp/Fnr family transcriptional regulator n=1 Tax=Actibacterium sp. TaxID=1872125 RepID=UPI00356217D1
MSNWIDRAQGLTDMDPQSRAILQGLPVTNLTKGHALFHPGEAARGFAIVLSGRIEVYLIGPTGREILLYGIEPGQSCVQSTLGLLGAADYTGEAVTTSEVELVLVPRDMFLTLIETAPVFRAFVFGAFATRMQSMMELLERVAFQKVESRLAAALLDQAQDDVVHTTHAELATRIGTAREVVSRRLDILVKRGLVRQDRGLVTVTNRPGLVALAEIDAP